jgi:L-fucose mutarotase/ribose pyranase (RbsD/FucU family)
MMSYTKLKITLMYFTGTLILVMATGCSHSRWRSEVSSEIPSFGHRNWIVIADSAYPKQSAAGIKTIYTGEEHLEVLDEVLEKIENALHVQAIVMVDKELDSVTEEDAPGISRYRKSLKEKLIGKQVKVMPHEEIIAELDKSAEMFNILLLKTTLTLPYTSVFLQLDCGYWNSEKESRLRKALNERPPDER